MTATASSGSQATPHPLARVRNLLGLDEAAERYGHFPSRVDLRHCGAEAVEGASPLGEFETERLLQSDAPGT
jgi:hypothetical protein